MALWWPFVKYCEQKTYNEILIIEDIFSACKLKRTQSLLSYSKYANFHLKKLISF